MRLTRLRQIGTDSLEAVLDFEITGRSDENIAAEIALLWKLLEMALDGAEPSTRSAPALADHHAKPSGPANGHTSKPEPHPNGSTISARQRSYLLGLASRSALKVPEVVALARDLLGDPNLTLGTMTKQEASAVIDHLKSAKT